MNVSPRTRFSLLAVLIFVTISVHAQVGINTPTPRTTLEVAGDMKTSQNLEVVTYNDLADGQSSTFLLQENSDAVKTIDVSNPTGAALGYIQEYEIVNPDEDWVRDFDTGVDATDFVLVPISAVYDTDLDIQPGGNRVDNYTLPYTASFISGGTWHIIADYPMAAHVDPSTQGTWIITTLIFSNDLSKKFGTVTITMDGGTTESASAPIID